MPARAHTDTTRVRNKHCTHHTAPTTRAAHGARTCGVGGSVVGGGDAHGEPAELGQPQLRDRRAVPER